MKRIKLTQGKYALVDDADFEWLNQWKWCAEKRPNTYYAVRNTSRKSVRKTLIRMHRLILGLTDPKILSDHRDHNGLNNQRANLRAATASQNSANKSSRKNSLSKYLGVSMSNRDKKWRAIIRKNRTDIVLGYFKNEVDAALAYNKKAIELHGEFANLNIIKQTKN